MQTLSSPIALILLAALTSANPSLAISADQPLVARGEALTAEQVAQLRGSDAINIYQTTREELLKIGDPRCKVQLDPSLLDFVPPAIDKRHFRAIAADAQYAPDTVYVRFKPGTTLEQKAQAHAAIGNVQISWESCLVNDLYQITLSGLNVPAAVNAYLDNPAVLYAEPSYLSSRDDTPNDPSFVDQWALKTGPGGIRAELAWDEATNANNIIVAVVDSGVDHTHTDIAANMWLNPGEIVGNGIDDDGNGWIDDARGWNFSANNNNTRPSCSDHGTHVAGTIGAVSDNITAVAGICWRAKIMALRCEYTPDPTCRSLLNTALAVEYAAANGARVVNCSYGGTSYQQSDFDIFAAAQAANMTAVCAAGNGGSDGIGDNNDLGPQYPGNYNLNNIISVAAIDESGALASFSNFGATTVDLGAPGTNILSLGLSQSTNLKNGTSMASPHVAGAAALVLSQYPTLTIAQLRARLLNSTTPQPGLANATTSGGSLNLHRALGLWCDPSGSTVFPALGSRAFPYRNFVNAVSVTPDECVLNLRGATTYDVPVGGQVITKPMVIKAAPGIVAQVR